jgi:Ran-binding protein 1
VIYQVKAKLFRWRNEWNERGAGDLKLLRHKENKKIRCVIRHDKTFKVVANFIVAEDPLCELKEYNGSDRLFYLTAYDCSDELPRVENFLIQIREENCKVVLVNAFRFDSL